MTDERSELRAVLAAVGFDAVDPRSPDARWAMGEYFAELDERFPTGFDADSARDEEGEAVAFSPPDGAFVVLHSESASIGCGGLQRIDLPDGPAAEIKRMWIRADWRGHGLARRLVDHLEQLAVERGARRVVLDTNSSLVEAIAMYESLGYEPTERYNDNPYAQRWFSKRL